MRLSLISAASLGAVLLAACAPAAEEPAPSSETETHQDAHDDHSHDAPTADAEVDRGAIEGPVALVEGTLLLPPAGRDVTAGFGTFLAGERAISIIGAEAPFAQAVELHTHETSADGKMAMRKVDDFAVPANGSHALARGGDHMMFFGVAPDRLVAGTTTDLTIRIQFEDGTTQDVTVPMTIAARD